MSFQPSARLLSLAAAWAGLSSLPAEAQLAPGTQLDPVLVTATGYPQPLTESLAHSTVLTREDIEGSQAIDLPALLAREAGLQMTRNGGRGAATTLFLRGAPSSQVLLLIDGVPQTRQDATGSISVENIMLDQVDRVEIVRGNVSAIYGSGAIGGVIQVFTRRGNGAPGGDATLEGGAYGYGHVAASASGQLGPTRLAIGISGQQTEGFSAMDPIVYPAANPDRDGYRNSSGSASISHEIAAGHTLALSLTQSDGKLAYDSAFATPVDVQTSQTRLSTARLASSNQFTSDWQSQLSFGWERDDSRYVETGTYGFDSQYISGNQALNWNNRYALTPDWHISAGVNLQRQSINTDDGFGGVYAKSRDVNALLAGAQGRIGTGSVQLNLRYDDIGGVGSKTTGYLGYGLQIAPQWKLVATASTAFNAPPLGYLYAPFFGNPALQPEDARSAELGVQYAADSQYLRATFFVSRVRNEFLYDPVSNKFENIASTDNHGLELTYNGVLGKSELGASLTLQDPVNAATGERLLRRAATLASASLWQPIGAWRVGVQGAYVGARTDNGGVTLTNYSLFSVLAQCELGRGVQLFGRVENLFDAKYQTVYGYNQPGFGAYLGVRWKV
jgi:vitamin B12 transporter